MHRPQPIALSGAYSGRFAEISIALSLIFIVVSLGNPL